MRPAMATTSRSFSSAARLALAVAIGALAEPASSQPTSNAFVFMSCRPDDVAPAGEIAFLSDTESSGAASCHFNRNMFNGSHISATATASGRIAIWGMNTPVAQAEARAQLTPYDDQSIDSFETEARSDITYTFKLEEITDAPVPDNALIPLKVRVFAFAAVDGGSAGAGVTFGSAVLASTGDLFGYGLSKIDGPKYAYVGIVAGGEKTVSAGGYCRVSVSHSPIAFVGFSSCNVMADPVIEFDQDTFDAQWGAQSFPLADYYRMVYSPNVELPEAEAWISAAVACFALAAARRRTR